MMISHNNGAATSPANQGGTSGSGGESNGHPNQSRSLPSDDAQSRVDGKVKEMGYKRRQKRRHCTRIGTWNVRTLSKPVTLNLLIREFVRCKLQLLGISEIRWSGKGHFTTDDGQIIYFSGNEKGGSKGVAFIASPFISKRVLGYNPVSDRIISIRLQARPINISVIQVYAPTSAASDEDIDAFYNQLQDVIDGLPKKDVLMVIGDFNAKIGKGLQHDEEAQIIGQHGLGKRNERGNMLVDFCIENNLSVANTMFSQHPRRLYTWQSPGGPAVCNQIDFILIKKRWKSSIKVAKTLPGADIGSDHQLLIADVKIKLKRIHNSQKIMRYDLQNISKQFWTETSNRFEELMLHEAEMTPDELWLGIKDSIQQTAKKHVPTKPKRKQSPWLSQEVIDLADERRHLKEAGLQNSNLYRKFSNEIQQKARRDKNSHINKLCSELEDHSVQNNSRDLFRGIKNLTNKTTAKLAVIKDENGKVLTEGADIKERWKNYCKGLYACQEVTGIQADVECNEEEPAILRSEVKNAIQKLKTNKAPGIDDIPGELFKNIDENGVSILLHLCNKIWHTRIWPEDWKKSVFLTLPKKGDVSECKNNRTIALIPHASKILLHILNERLRPHLERELPSEQAGFRRGRGTRDHIANIRHIIEKCKEYKRKAYLCFIDYAKAFDCVRYGPLWIALQALGVPSHLVQLLKSLYDGQLACVRTAQGDSDWFNLGQGVRQGCILSPTLFNLYAEHIMRHVLDGWTGGISVGGWQLHNLRYADDTTLLATSLDELGILLKKVKNESESLGLRLNVAKTKFMVIGDDGNNTPLLVDGQNVDQIQQFNFLGSLITQEGGCQTEIRRRLAMARSAMTQLSKIWTDRGITISTKVRLVKALIFPISTYGCESWTLTTASCNKINAFEMWCWRRMLRITWVMKRTNVSVLQEVGVKTRLLGHINSQTLSYFGHIARRQGNCLEKVIMQGKIEGARGPGRPKSRWFDRIKSLVGQPTPIIYRLAADRRKWSVITKVTSCQP